MKPERMLRLIHFWRQDMLIIPHHAIYHGGRNCFEGIDTISFRLNRRYVNSSEWFHQGDADSYKPVSRKLAEGISLRSQRTDYGTCYYCDIQQEALRMDMDILFQVENVVRRLIMAECLIIHPKYANKADFVSHYGHPILAKLTSLDFFHDFRQKDVVFSENPSAFKTTRYSPDHKKKTSLICLYDKNSEFEAFYRLGKCSELKRTDAPVRCEFRLRNSNCRYLSFENLRGTYQDVFRRYRMHLAKIWRRYGSLMGEIHTDIRHENFHLLQFLAACGEKIPNLGDLRKTPEGSFLPPPLPKTHVNINTKKNNDKSYETIAADDAYFDTLFDINSFTADKYKELSETKNDSKHNTSETVAADDEDDAYLYKLFGMTSSDSDKLKATSSSDDSDKNKQSKEISENVDNKAESN